MEQLPFYKKPVFRPKNPALRFLCPLCGVERALRLRQHMSFRNYLQILCISSLLALILYPLMKERVFYCFFVVWAIYEWSYRVLFRRELPCPHCGLDAFWYKRDVTIAKKRIKKFWSSQNDNLETPQTTNLEDQSPPEEKSQE